MWIIKSLVIDKLWGEKNVIVDFNNKLNILIGSNGVGKTTILKILESSLAIDSTYLNNLMFNQIKLLLQNDQGNKRTLKIEKTEKGIKYYISGKVVLNEIEDDDYSEFVFLGNESRLDANRERKKQKLIESFDLPKAKLLPASRISLNESINVNKRTLSRDFRETWTSSSIQNQIDITEPLNIKIDYLIRELNSEISRINITIKQEDQNFRNELFRYNFKALDNAFSDVELSTQYSNVTKLLSDENATKELLVDIKKLFKLYNFEQASMGAIKLESLISLGKAINGKGLMIKDVMLISSISFWVEAIRAYKQYNEKIDESRSRLTQLENTFKKIFSNKFIIETNSELIIKKANNGDYASFNPYNFSSGEKQMFIYLLENVLHVLPNCIYLIDEPEISLHLKWQNEYLNTLTVANTSTQFFVATHSPDIVGTYKDCLINLDKKVSNYE